METRPQGFDCSHNNGNIDWGKLNPEYKFVFIKATQGRSFKDPMYTIRVKIAKEKGLSVGSYHFLTAIDSAQSQADNFLVRYIPGTMIVIDVEDQIPASLNVNITRDRSVFIQLIKDWISIVETKTGKKVIFYSYRNFFKEYLLNTPDFGGQPLWLASYQEIEPGLPPGFEKYTFWQDSEYGNEFGTPVKGSLDINVFNGSLQELTDFSNKY